MWTLKLLLVAPLRELPMDSHYDRSCLLYAVGSCAELFAGPLALDTWLDVLRDRLIIHLSTILQLLVR